ncbi:RNase P and RNase MRP subunit [Coemansia sp. RSA 2607]|nr:RNase P and RNase MRP subunit [Coemansia sp. RSA 2607]
MAGSLRAAGSVRAAGQKRRPMLKYALEKPYTTLWPSVPQELQSLLVDELCSVVQPVCAYVAESRRVSKQRGVQKARASRKELKAAKAAKTNKTGVSADKADTSCADSKNNPTLKTDRASVRKVIRERGSGESGSDDIMTGLDLLDHIVVGINANTRALERQARAAPPTRNVNDLALVFVCRANIDPQLVAHFPALAHVAHARESAATTQTGNSGGLRLVGLGRGLEQRLATAIGLDRVTVIGIRAGSAVLDRVIEMARNKVPAPSVPWIGTSRTEKDSIEQPDKHMLHPMAVRELHTSAPIQQNRLKTEKANTERKKGN